MREGKGRARSIFGVIGNVLMYIFFAVCVFALVMSVASKKSSEDALNIFGIQMRVVVSDSMAECPETDVSAYKIKDIPIRSLVFIESVPEDADKRAQWYDSLAVGDVLTFKYVYVTQETITHRVTEITPKEGGYIIELEGDNKASDADTLKQTIDTTLDNSPNYIIGKVVGKSFILGLLITTLKTPVGVVLTVILPCVIIMILQVIRLAGVFADKRADDARRRESERDEEIAELKRRLEALQDKESGEQQSEDRSND